LDGTTDYAAEYLMSFVILFVIVIWKRKIFESIEKTFWTILRLTMAQAQFAMPPQARRRPQATKSTNKISFRQKNISIENAKQAL